MRPHGPIPIATLGALLVACAPAPQATVPLVGAAPDLAALAGTWEGSYSSAATGRSGSISFTLRATSDSAFGDVVMIPRGFGRPVEAWDRSGGPTYATAPRPAVLTIKFVRVAEGRVTGALAPYADPETGVQLFTTFDGRLSGDEIAGTYTTRRGDTDVTQDGEWQVTRRKR